MHVIRSLCIAFSTYSRIPVPQVAWTDENRKYSMCFFPLIGAVIGLLLWGWLALCDVLGFGALLRGAVGALLPILVLLVIFNILKVNISLSILLTALVSAALFFPQLGGKKIMSSFNEGAQSSLIPVGAIAGVNGFAAVIQAVPEYQILIDSLLNATVPPVILLVVCIAIICMMTGGSTTGTQIALPIITPALTKLGLSLPFIHRVGTFAATTLDSLPNSGAVIMAVGLADLKMKDGYPPVFVSTVLATISGTAAVAIIMTLFPMLP